MSEEIERMGTARRLHLSGIKSIFLVVAELDKIEKLIPFPSPREFPGFHEKLAGPYESGESEHDKESTVDEMSNLHLYR